jgi:hypothetical protein
MFKNSSNAKSFNKAAHQELLMIFTLILLFLLKFLQYQNQMDHISSTLDFLGISMKKYTLIMSSLYMGSFSLIYAAQRPESLVKIEHGHPYQRTHQHPGSPSPNHYLDAVLDCSSHSPSDPRKSPPRPLNSEPTTPTDPLHIRSIDQSFCPLTQRPPYQAQDLAPTRQDFSPLPPQPDSSQQSSQQRPPSPEIILLTSQKTQSPFPLQQRPPIQQHQIPMLSLNTSDPTHRKSDEERMYIMAAFAEVGEAELCYKMAINRSCFRTATANAADKASSFLAYFIKKLSRITQIHPSGSSDLNTRLLKIRQAKLCSKIIRDEINFSFGIRNEARIFIQYFTEGLLLHDNH